MKPLLAALLLLSAALPARAAEEEKPKPNTLTPKEIAEGWLMLFDGETTFGWKTEGDVKVDGGVLVVGGKQAATVETTTAWGDCELRLEYSTDNWLKSRLSVNGRPLFHPPAVKLGKGDWVEVHWKAQGNRIVSTARFGEGQSNNEFPRHAEAQPIKLATAAGDQLLVRSIKLKPLGLKPLFNGKDLAGWKEIPGKKSKFAVTDEGWLNVKDGPGDLQTEGQYGDFILQLDCISNGDHLNSGVFFRCLPGEFWSGYEAQVRNQWEKDDRTKPVDYGTGGIYNRQPARKVVSSDKEWFTMTVVAGGNHLATWVNGYQTADFTDTRPADKSARKGSKTDKGPVSLQGHDPTTDLSFRNIRIAELPQAEK